MSTTKQNKNNKKNNGKQRGKTYCFYIWKEFPAFHTHTHNKQTFFCDIIK